MARFSFWFRVILSEMERGRRKLVAQLPSSSPMLQWSVRQPLLLLKLPEINPLQPSNYKWTNSGNDIDVDCSALWGPNCDRCSTSTERL
jgi:hypothetical protein